MQLGLVGHERLFHRVDVVDLILCELELVVQLLLFLRHLRLVAFDRALILLNLAFDLVQFPEILIQLREQLPVVLRNPAHHLGAHEHLRIAFRPKHQADRAGVVPRNVHRAHPLFEQLHRAVDLGLLLLHLDLFLLNIAV